MQVTIRLRDKRNGEESNPIPIEELIYHQHDIEFTWDDYTDEFGCVLDVATLPYNDFLFFRDDYDVIVKINENK